MFKKFLHIALVVFGLGALANTAYARGQFFGYVEKGGNSTLTSGSMSSNKVQVSYPGSRVSVYVAGTVTLATLYSDSGGTAKANPFTAGTDGSFTFWTDTSVFDITFDRKGITTQCGLSYPGYPCIAAFTWYGKTANSQASSSVGYNVIDYGAVCDGIGGTDNHIAIQNAINAASAAGGAAVTLPSATCYIGTTGLTLPQGVTLAGNGPTNSIIHYAGTGYAVTGGSRTATNHVYGVGIRDLKIYLTNDAGNGIEMATTAFSTLSNVNVEGTNGAGNTGVSFYMNAGGYFSTRNRYEHLWSNHQKIGMRFGTTGSMVGGIPASLNTAIDVTDFHFAGVNGTIANAIGIDIIYTGQCQGCQFFGGDIEAGTASGIAIQSDGYYTSFFGTRFENNWKELKLTTNARGFSIYGCMGLTTVTDTSTQQDLVTVGCVDSSGNPYLTKFSSSLELLEGPRSILLRNSTTGFLRLQAGPGSAGLGGGIFMYGSSHATYPGDVVVGLGSGAAAREFRVATDMSDTGVAFQVKGDGSIVLRSIPFASLVSYGNGTMVYCSDCTKATPCAGGGGGALAKRIAGAWDCN